MKTETINKIVLNDRNELTLLLDSNGESMYQYVTEKLLVFTGTKNKKGLCQQN